MIQTPLSLRLRLVRTLAVLLAFYPIYQLVGCIAYGFSWLEDQVFRFMYRNEVCLDDGFRVELQLLIEEITD